MLRGMNLPFVITNLIGMSVVPPAWLEKLSQDPNQMALWALIIGVVALLVSGIGTIAAIAAAKFAHDSPTKDDLKRVEENTAHLLHMKDRIINIDTRSELQAAKDKRGVEAGRLSVSVRANGLQSEPLAITLETKDTSIPLTRIELLNADFNLFGSAPCDRVKECQYVAPVSTKAMSNWFHGGNPTQNFNRMRLQLRIWMMIEDDEVYRYLPVVLTSGTTGTPQGNQAAWIIEGDI